MAFLLGLLSSLSYLRTLGKKCSFASVDLATKSSSFIAREGRINLGKEAKLYSCVS